jgi:hypothetical protein
LTNVGYFVDVIIQPLPCHCKIVGVDFNFHNAAFLKDLCKKAAVGRSIVIKEALWFLQAQFPKLKRSEISSLMSIFYTYEEVADAKCLLFDFAKAINADYVPVFTERKGVNKIRATVDDLLGLYTLLDVHKVELPIYLVLDIRRIPAMDSKIDVDVSVVAALTTLVNDLRQQVSTPSDK